MGVVLMLKKDCWSWNVLKRREIFRFFTGICKRIGVYIHVYPKCRFIFSFYSASGFYIVGPVRLERFGKASVDFIGSSLTRKNKIFSFFRTREEFTDRRNSSLREKTLRYVSVRHHRSVIEKATRPTEATGAPIPVTEDELVTEYTYLLGFCLSDGWRISYFSFP